MNRPLRCLTKIVLVSASWNELLPVSEQRLFYLTMTLGYLAVVARVVERQGSRQKEKSHLEKNLLSSFRNGRQRRLVKWLRVRQHPVKRHFVRRRRRPVPKLRHVRGDAGRHDRRKSRFRQKLGPASGRGPRSCRRSEDASRRGKSFGGTNVFNLKNVFRRLHCTEVAFLLLIQQSQVRFLALP